MGLGTAWYGGLQGILAGLTKSAEHPSRLPELRYVVVVVAHLVPGAPEDLCQRVHYRSPQGWKGGAGRHCSPKQPGIGAKSIQVTADPGLAKPQRALKMRLIES